jgi:cutinase
MSTADRNSQGTAVMAGALGALDAVTQAQVKGCVLYGYTHNKQNGGVIPGFPVAKTDVYCSKADAVCDGVLAVTAAHFSYSVEAKVNGPRFLIDHI